MEKEWLAIWNVFTKFERWSVENPTLTSARRDETYLSKKTKTYNNIHMDDTEIRFLDATKIDELLKIAITILQTWPADRNQV